MARHNDTGKIGEELALQYYEALGFRILETNWRFKRLEVDIIASKERMLYFIEVKCRRSKVPITPEEAVTIKKLKNLIDASEEYLHQHPQWLRIQFDVLAITLKFNDDVEYFRIEDVYL